MGKWLTQKPAHFSECQIVWLLFCFVQIFYSICLTGDVLAS